MRRLRRAADSVNLASFLSPKEIRFQCIKWEAESRPKILIVGVLEERGLLGIRNLDLKMNVFFVFFTQCGHDLCLLNLTTGPTVYIYLSMSLFLYALFHEWSFANEPHHHQKWCITLIKYLQLHKHATCLGCDKFGACKNTRIFSRGLYW